MKKLFNSILRTFTNAYRDPRFVLTAFFSLVGLLFTTSQVLENDKLDNFEKYIFELINGLGDNLYAFFYIITQFGSLASLVAWGLVIGFYFRKRAAIAAIFSGFLGWLLAKPLKVYIGRGRPGELLESLNLFSDEKFSGLGYPSGHATLSAAAATAVYLYLKPKNRKYLLFFVGLIGVSRIYLGGHFPRDVIGGWFLGVLCGCTGSLLIGSSRQKVTKEEIKKALDAKGIKVKTIEEFYGDARGSRPLLITLVNGNKMFGKIISSQEHAADWIFKTFRFFRFKNFRDEDPYLNPKRHVEHEAFLAEWARKFGVQTPQVHKIVNVNGHWMLLQEKIDAKPLSSQKTVTTKALEQIWAEIKKLHDADIAHRDLRAANILIDSNNKPWIIDFDFAEVSGESMRKYMDIAEFLTATSLQFGVKKSLSAARSALGDTLLINAAPYVQAAALSGATSEAARRNKQEFEDLKYLLSDICGQEQLEEKQIQRLTKKQFINLLLLGVFFFVIIPKFNIFKDSLSPLVNVNFYLLPIIAGFSAATYACAAGVITTIPSIPVSYRKSFLAQLAGSYASKIAPRGLGSGIINLQFLKKQGLDTAQATSVVLVEKILGLLLFAIPLAFVLVVGGHSSLSDILPEIKALYVYITILVLAAAALVAYFNSSLKNKAVEYIARGTSEIKLLAQRPRSFLIAIIMSFGVSVTYVITLYYCLEALQVDISIIQIIIAYAAATFASSVTPTPGGLGGFEAGLIAAMISFGVDQGSAYSTAILYRLVTFWLPIPFALAAYKYVDSKNII